MKKTNLLLTFFIIVAIASCDNSKTENQFTLLSSNDTGVDFINKLYEDNQINYFTYPYIYMGGGVSVGDINNDDLDDILFTTRNGGSLYLYRNQGDMTFSDVSFESNIGMMMEARTAVAGDYDNDGDFDVFIGASIGSSVFFQNNGDGTFQNITSLVGINVEDQVRGCSWVDYNNDGYLDLYVGLLYPSNKLFKNNGDNTFTEVAQNIGAAGPLAAGIIMGLGFIDYDRDGDQDLFITQDNNNGNILLRNDSGLFSDISAISNTNLEVMGMGVAFGDINRDGLFDFYTTKMSEEGGITEINKIISKMKENHNLYVENLLFS